MRKDLYVRFSIMTFLEWFIMGTWMATIGNYMTEIDMAELVYWAYSVVPISAMVSPYFMGLFVDRYFDSEKVLGWLHIVSGAALALVPLGASIGSPAFFLSALFLHGLCYAPTISLTASLPMHHMTDNERQYPIIRVFGTIGWIVAGVFVSRVLHADTTPIPLYVGAISSVIFGLYSFTLPHTPPPKKGQKASFKTVIDFNALKRLSSRPFWIFLISVFLVWIVAAAYYPYTPILIADLGITDPAFKMTFGQMSEILFMLLIPLAYPKLGAKWMLAIGILAWAVRYFLFSFAVIDATLWMVIVGIALHGVCFDGVYVVGQIYIDKKAGPEIRGQAQGLLVFAMSGFGQLLGTIVMGEYFNELIVGTDHAASSWQAYWLYPAVLATVILLAFIVFFNDKQVDRKLKAEGV